MAYNYLQRIAIAGAQSSQLAMPPAAAAPQMPPRSLPLSTASLIPPHGGAPSAAIAPRRYNTRVEVELPPLRPDEFADPATPPAPAGDEEPTRRTDAPAPGMPAGLPPGAARHPPRTERADDAPMPDSVPASRLASAGDQTTPRERASDSDQSPHFGQPTDVPGAVERTPPLPVDPRTEQSNALLAAAGREPSQPRSIQELTRALLPTEQRAVIQAPAALRPAPPARPGTMVPTPPAVPPNRPLATSARPPQPAADPAAARVQSTTNDADASDAWRAAPMLAPRAPDPPAAKRADVAQVEAPPPRPGTMVPTTPSAPVMPPLRPTSVARDHRITIGRVEVEVHNPGPAPDVPAKTPPVVTPLSLLDARYLNRFAFRP